MTSLSSLRFLTVCWRCQRAVSHCVLRDVLLAGKRRQSGSTNSRSSGYLKGWSLAPTLAAGFQTGRAALAVLMTRIIPPGPWRQARSEVCSGLQHDPAEESPRRPSSWSSSPSGCRVSSTSRFSRCSSTRRSTFIGRAAWRSKGGSGAHSPTESRSGGGPGGGRSMGSRSAVLGSRGVGGRGRRWDGGRVGDRPPPSRRPCGALRGRPLRRLPLRPVPRPDGAGRRVPLDGDGLDAPGQRSP